MMDYKIRIANKNDVKNLAVLKQRVWSETYRGIYSDDLIDKFDYEKAEETFLNIIDFLFHVINIIQMHVNFMKRWVGN